MFRGSTAASLPSRRRIRPSRDHRHFTNRNYNQIVTSSPGFAESELLELPHAEYRVESLAIDNYGVVFVRDDYGVVFV